MTDDKVLVLDTRLRGRDPRVARQNRPTHRGKGFFRTSLRQTMSRKRRQGMVVTDHPRLSIARQCQVIGLARSTWYHRPQNEKAVNLDLMRLIDAQFLETPFYGSRQMQRHLKDQGVVVGRTRVRRLMCKMGLMAIYKNGPGPAFHIQSKRSICISCVGCKLSTRIRCSVQT